jgi:ethanolamine ammonia-lyase small subunit
MSEQLPAPSSATVSLRGITPARLLLGRSGTSYRTSTLLDLREDHAAARDAVHAELEPGRPDLALALRPLDPVTVGSAAADRREHLTRPDLGRRLSAEGRETVAGLPTGADLQLVVGDGLSAAAVHAQVPVLLPALVAEARDRGLTLGRLVVVHQCRVGIVNEIGELLAPSVVALLIGERPGLSCAVSLSAYLAYRPKPGDTDAQRNLISNIHADGIPPAQAATMIVELAERLRARGFSGVGA